MTSCTNASDRAAVNISEIQEKTKTTTRKKLQNNEVI